MEKQIFVVNMNEKLCCDLRYALRNNDINIRPIVSISKIVSNYYMLPCDLIILELLRFETTELKELRVILCNHPVPVLILYAELSVDEKICLYQAGASALLQKMIPAEICAAQALALIRLRAEADDWPKQCPLIFGTELTIDPSCRIVKVNGEILSITKKEFDLLFCLAHNRK